MVNYWGGGKGPCLICGKHDKKEHKHQLKKNEEDVWVEVKQ